MLCWAARHKSIQFRCPHCATVCTHLLSLSMEQINLIQFSYFFLRIHELHKAYHVIHKATLAHIIAGGHDTMDHGSSGILYLQLTTDLCPLIVYGEDGVEARSRFQRCRGTRKKVASCASSQPWTSFETFPSSSSSWSRKELTSVA